MAEIIRSPVILKSVRTLGFDVSRDVPVVKPIDIPVDVHSDDVEIADQPVFDSSLHKAQLDIDKILQHNNPVENKTTELDSALLNPEILKQALSRAEDSENALKKINDNLDNEIKSARDSGYKSGYDEGIVESRQELGGLLSTLVSVSEKIADQKKSSLVELEDTFVEIVFAAVSKVLVQTACSKSVIKDIVDDVEKKYINENGKVVIRLHPDDYKLLQSSAEFDDKSKLKIAPDDRVKYGGYIIGTKSGSIDARLNIQMERFLECLLRARKSVEL